MTSGKQRGNVFQHPGEAALRDKIDRSRQLRAEILGRGASVFIGYIRSHARTKAEAQEGQEEAWQQDTPPGAA